MPEAIPGLPTVDQELLLKALLFDGEPAIESWNAWRRRISVEEIDLGSQRLLPLLLEKLRRMRVDHPDLRKYQSVARYIWSKNQLLVHVTRQVICFSARKTFRRCCSKGLQLRFYITIILV
jgi:hypothetical protein